MRPDQNAARQALSALGLSPSAKLTPIETGHINESYRVDAMGAPRLLLQWLNHDTFPAADAVQANMERVLAHLQAAACPCPRLVRGADGAGHVRIDSGLWRAFHWLAERRTLVRPDGPGTAAGAGVALGRTLSAMADLPTAELQPAVAGFHDLGLRLAALDAAVADAPASRLAAASPWLARVEAEREQRIGTLAAVAHDRLLHGDPKFSNFMFGRDPEVPVVLVDWDTVMVGPLAWDFGDLLRSAAGRGNEDDPDGAGVDEALLLAAAQGFCSGLGEAVDQGSAQALASAPAHMAFMLAVRFLTDHLDGDRYFRISRPLQNLERAATQFALVAAFDDARQMLGESLLRPDRPAITEDS